METGKVYSLFGKNGMMEEIKPVGELPIGTRILAFGALMSDQVFCITSGMTDRGQKMCLVSNYYEDAYFSPTHYFDKHSRPLSAKFGIGFYWDDVDNIVFPESKVLAAIRRADYLKKKIAEREKAIEEANKKDIAELPSRYPHLTPINQKEDRYKQFRANLVAELKHCFPGAKFSIKKRSYSSVDVCWTNGPALRDVKLVTSKFEDHVTDFTGDFRDYEPSNFNHVFGGIDYVFEEREYSFDYEKLTDELATRANIERRDASGDLYAMFQKTSFPKEVSNLRIDVTGIRCGSISDYYTIAFDTPEKKEIQEPKKIEVNGIEVIDYSDKSFAVYGNTKPIKEELKELGGRFNMYLKATSGFTFAGWIFPLTKKQAVLSALGYE